jgi:NAD(P)-dependent dehydrogenase (short-subunit alcohol dehydrogenase family)
LFQLIDNLQGMTKTALVTGATQGLGLALVEGLARRLGEDDVVYLTGRDARRLTDASRALRGCRAQVRTETLDVASDDSVQHAVALLTDRHGGVDIIFSNAYSRVQPDDDPVEAIDDYVQTNNLGTTRVLRAFAPVLRDRGRLIVVASTAGTLHHLAPVLHDRFDNLGTLDDVDRAVDAWRDAVHSGRAPGEGWPAFINIPSKVAQVAAVRALARTRRTEDLRRGILLAAVCPGMIDTGASRPWFDMSHAQTPQQAAGPLLDLALDPAFDPCLYGELVRFGTILPWAS